MRFPSIKEEKGDVSAKKKLSWCSYYINATTKVRTMAFLTRFSNQNPTFKMSQNKGTEDIHGSEKE